MTLFAKKEKIILNSEQQKDDFVEKLNSANISYDIKELNESVFSGKTTYIVKLSAKDLKKVV
ncbi:MAG: hypothetical protein K6A38_06460 [Lachnospiraceae bacterium]|nr:hypothetical protein [Lachnospiraceae bacterium]